MAILRSFQVFSEESASGILRNERRVYWSTKVFRLTVTVVVVGVATRLEGANFKPNRD